LEGRAREIDAQRRECESFRQDLERERQQWQAQFEAERTELESARQQIQAEREDWDRQREEELTQLAARREAGTAELACPQCDHEQATELAGASYGGGAAPVNLADVFRRVGMAVPGAEDESNLPQAAVAPPRENTTPQPQPEPAAEEAEEDSIEAYMAQLLKRAGGSSTAAKSGHEGWAASSSSVAKPALEQTTGVKGSGTPSPTAPPQRPVRKPTPAAPVDLSAMRELANLSAQSAIARHSRSRQSRALRTKLLLTILGTLVCGAAWWFWWRAPTQAMGYAALAGLLVAAGWGLQYAVLRISVFFARRRLLAWQQAPASDLPEPDASDEDTPELDDMDPPATVCPEGETD